MDELQEITTQDLTNSEDDFSFVNSAARIALYDDFLSSPRITEISPAPTRDFIGNLASTIYTQARSAGGNIPYTIIEQVSENFIHAYFTEMIVSIFDNGNTIRFTDQGPGILNKDKAQQPGYSSATQDMKKYIHGVGSGLPIVREYLDTKNGTIQIEDNMNTGAVVTISLVKLPDKIDEYTHQTQDRSDISLNTTPSNLSDTSNDPIAPFKSSSISSGNEISKVSMNLLLSSLSKRAKNIILLFNNEDIWGVTAISEMTNIPTASVHNELAKLEQLGLVTHIGRKRALTELGNQLLSIL